MTATMSRPPKVGKEWQEILRLIPGYDPFATAGDAWFEAKLGNRAVGFFEECLRHVEGDCAGKPFLLEPWEKAFVGNLFGWVRVDLQGRVVRRYRETLLYVPRKNGKTPLSAGLCLYGLLCDEEPGAQIYSAASERKTAALIYRHAVGMVAQERELEERCRIYRASKSIVLKSDPASSYLVLAADASHEHGGNSHLVVIDELHAQPNRHLVDVLKTSFASEGRRQPLMVYITTADFDRPSICNEKYDYACKVRDGIFSDHTFLPVIYEAKIGDDWTSPEMWLKANPNLGISVSREYLATECEKAKNIPAYANTFKRLHLNVRTASDILAIPMEQWDACGLVPADEAALLGQECWGGLDLASTTDIAALVLVFPITTGGYWLLPRFWVPQENIAFREKRDEVPYQTWAEQGLLKPTQGNKIDYDVIRKDVNSLQQIYHIKEIAIDRWNATQITTQLMGDGLKMIEFGQGYASMTAPTKELLGLISDRKIQHGGHPVLRWMASNMAVQTDAADNIKPTKAKVTDKTTNKKKKIDGIVATIMAIGRAMVRPEYTYQPGDMFA